MLGVLLKNIYPVHCRRFASSRCWSSISNDQIAPKRVLRAADYG